MIPANNQDSAADELDLHGLYVKEAIRRTDEAIVAAQSRGEGHINVIVGKVCVSNIQNVILIL
jgi:DNA-nicking Smr family endonuclease